MREARLGLLTSSGHFLTGQDPEPFGVPHMTQEEAVRRVSEFLKTEPELSPVPVDTPPADLQVRHGGYDIRGAQADPEVVLPLKTLRELENEGRFGSLHDPAYTFVGAAAQRRLLKGAGPKWVNMFQAAQLDGVLLVPV
jgi:hypothetical protein